MKPIIFQFQLEAGSLISKRRTSFHDCYLRPLSIFAIIFLYAINALWAQPVNDLCTNAISITAPVGGGTNFTGSGSTLSATSTGFPESCGGVDNSTVGGVWYTFDGAPNTLYSLSTCHPNTDFDTEISVHSFSGSGSCLTELVCEGGNNDDATCGNGESTLSIFVPPALMPTTYYLYVKGNGTAAGFFDVSLTNGPPLPIELVFFKGSVAEKSNRLSWETASEMNTEKHVVERSSNGATGWSEIGEIRAIGFSAEIQQYDFEDTNPPPSAYYRLRSIDFDGQEDVSALVHLDRPKEGFSFIDLVPNPAQDFVTVHYNKVTNSPVTFTLMNVQGQVIRHWSVDERKGDHREQVVLKDLHQGLYFIQINNGTESISKRILHL